MERSFVLFLVKFFFLIIFPVGICLPVIVVARPNAGATAALILLTLLPHILVPIAWMIGKFTYVFSVDKFFTSQLEVIGLACFSGFILPVVILIPVLTSISMDFSPYCTLLGCILVLVDVWFPLLVAIFWAPVVVLEKAKDRTALISHELKYCFLGLFSFFSVPLGFLLPLCLLGSSYGLSLHGEAGLMFFMLCVPVVAFFVLLSPRITQFLHINMKFGAHATVRYIYILHNNNGCVNMRIYVSIF